MGDKSIKELAKKISGSAPGKRQTKSNRTLSLTEPQYTIMQKYCRSKGYKVSEIIDNLIEIFLKEVDGDIPIDLSSLDE